jgi:hypothetical protein
VSANALEVEVPKLKEDEIIKIAERYLVEEKGIDLEKYVLENVTFGDAGGKYSDSHKWHLLYKMAVERNRNQSIRRTGWFTVSVSNQTKPEIEFSMGY